MVVYIGRNQGCPAYNILSRYFVEHLVCITQVAALRVRFQKGCLELNYGLVPKFYNEGMKLFSLGGGVFVVAGFEGIQQRKTVNEVESGFFS